MGRSKSEKNFLIKTKYRDSENQWREYRWCVVNRKMINLNFKRLYSSGKHVGLTKNNEEKSNKLNLYFNEHDGIILHGKKCCNLKQYYEENASTVEVTEVTESIEVIES